MIPLVANLARLGTALRACLPVLALAFFAAAPAAATAAQENLVPEGAFASDRDRAKGWVADNPKQGWLRDNLKVVTEDGRTFLRSTKSAAIIKLEKPVDPAWSELELRFDSRRADVVKGKNRWDVPSAELDFLGADGKSLLDWRKTVFLDGDAPAWTPVTRRYWEKVQRTGRPNLPT